MEVIAIIPARAGSKGIPGKNSKFLGGKSLIAYSIEAAIAAQCFSTIIVTTDDEACLSIATDYPEVTAYKRPVHLSQDSTPTIAVVEDVLHYMQQQDLKVDAVCLLQPTTPFREPGSIKNAISQFTITDNDSLISVLPVPKEFNPHWVFKPTKDHLLQIATGDETIIPRRQELPEAYHRDGSIYITKTSVIEESQSLYGRKIGYVISNAAYYVNIDTPSDWEKAVKLLKTWPR